jgi:hypothetical protein
MKRPFWDDGDEVCRTSWLERRTIDERIGSSYGFPIFRCRSCGTYWEQTEKGIVAIPEAKALRLVNGEPEPPSPRLPDVLRLPAHRDWPRVDGRVILPDMPQTPAVGRDAHLRWEAEVLTAVADVLDAAPDAEHHLLRMLHRVDGGGRLHRDGYNLLVPGALDWERARALLDPNLPDDWQRDAGPGPATAIGVLSRTTTLRGPSELESVGTGFTGRRRLVARAREYDAWRASLL